MFLKNCLILNEVSKNIKGYKIDSKLPEKYVLKKKLLNVKHNINEHQRDESLLTASRKMCI